MIYLLNRMKRLDETVESSMREMDREQRKPEPNTEYIECLQTVCEDAYLMYEAIYGELMPV